MKKIAIVILLSYFSFFSCVKDICGCSPLVPPRIKAEIVQSNNIDCNRPLIKIDVTDTAEVSRATRVYTDTYIASQLPDSLKNAGQKLFISISSFGFCEDFACTTIGPAYAHLKVYDAVKRN